MKEMVKSKIIIGFIVLVLGIVYINTPTLNYSENKQEISDSKTVSHSYNI